MMEIEYMKEMTDSRRMMFQSQYNQERKDFTVCLLLGLFLGGLGGHHFYMGKVGLGILYVVFVWTFIPSIISFFELFVLKSRVNKYNEAVASKIASVVIK